MMSQDKPKKGSPAKGSSDNNGQRQVTNVQRSVLSVSRLDESPIRRNHDDSSIGSLPSLVQPPSSSDSDTDEDDLPPLREHHLYEATPSDDDDDDTPPRTPNPPTETLPELERLMGSLGFGHVSEPAVHLPQGTAEAALRLWHATSSGGRNAPTQNFPEDTGDGRHLYNVSALAAHDFLDDYWGEVFEDDYSYDEDGYASDHEHDEPDFRQGD